MFLTWRTPSWRALRSCCAKTATPSPQRERSPTTSSPPGGGAKSPVWCQLQADITGLPVIVPREKEAACLGAAIVAAVSDRQYADYAQAAAHCVAMVTRYEPHPTAFLETKYRRFALLYQAGIQAARL